MGDTGSWVVASIRHELESLPALSSNSCIYIVPENLRKVNEDAYRPLLVSIGPFYYNDSSLLAMQEQKLRYLQSFLQRSDAYNLVHYVEIIKEWEQAARQCYVEEVRLRSEEFIKMVLIDAAFIIELFVRSYFNRYIEKNDRIFNKPRMIAEVIRDIRLAENQLPFFILKGLYDLAFSPSSQNAHPSFAGLSYTFLTGKKDPFPQEITTSDIKHLVDFLRLCYLPSARRKEDSSKSERTNLFSPGVTELSEAGIKFKASSSKDLLDIKFSKGVLVIPSFTVADDTESLFRNIMVFEQCHYYYDSYIIDYFAFLDSLINTPKDVDILVQNGIIDNWLGSNEEVANLFKNIFKQTRLQVANFYYSELCRDLNAYAKTSWHQWKAILKHNYFNHPWAVISFIYAIVLLILTVLQTVTGFTPNK